MNVRRDFDEKLLHIQQQVERMGLMTADFIDSTVEAMIAMNAVGAKAVRQDEKQIDAIFRQIDERCIVLMATQQPAAGDLRFLVSSMKIASELERIADYANNIAKKVQRQRLANMTVFLGEAWNDKVRTIGRTASSMLREAMQAYVQHDAAAVAGIVTKDETVNMLNTELFTDILRAAPREQAELAAVFEVHTVIRYIERMADRSTNIAEQVFYMSKGFPYTKF